MTREEHLLTIAAEECAEIAQRLSKALRFGLFEVQPGQSLDNCERIRREFNDLVSVLGMVEETVGTDLGALIFVENDLLEAKRSKVEDFLKLSAEQGRLAA